MAARDVLFIRVTCGHQAVHGEGRGECLYMCLFVWLYLSIYLSIYYLFTNTVTHWHLQKHELAKMIPWIMKHELYV